MGYFMAHDHALGVPSGLDDLIPDNEDLALAFTSSCTGKSGRAPCGWRTAELVGFCQCPKCVDDQLARIRMIVLSWGKKSCLGLGRPDVSGWWCSGGGKGSRNAQNQPGGYVVRDANNFAVA